MAKADKANAAESVTRLQRPRYSAAFLFGTNMDDLATDNASAPAGSEPVLNWEQTFDNTPSEPAKADEVKTDVVSDAPEAKASDATPEPLPADETTDKEHVEAAKTDETDAEPAEDDEEPTDYFNDPKKVIDALPGKGAKAAAERWHADAKATRTLKNHNVPIVEAINEMAAVSPNRFNEMAQTMVLSSLTDPETRDGWLQNAIREVEPDLKDITFDEIVKSVKAMRAGTIEPVIDTNIDWSNEENDDLMTESEKALAKIARDATKKAEAAEKKVADLQPTVDSIKTEQEQNFERNFKTKRLEYANQFQDSIETPFREKLFKKHGLEIQKDDTADVKAIKGMVHQLFTDSPENMSEFQMYAFDGDFTDKEKVTTAANNLAKHFENAARADLKGDTKTRDAELRAVEDYKQEMSVLAWKAMEEFTGKKVRPILNLLKENAELKTKLRNSAATRGQSELVNGKTVMSNGVVIDPNKGDPLGQAFGV